MKLTSDPDVQHPFTGRAYKALDEFGSSLRDWTRLRERVSVGELLDAVLDQINYRAYLADGTEEGEDRWANVMELRGVAGIDEGLSLAEFLQQVALVAETDNLDTDTKAPTLLTLHAAKGLEFPVVFITGLEDGLLPHSRSVDTREDLAEERRLFYVGLTRAKDLLFLSHAFRRTSWGDSSVGVPSRFLADIPEELIDGVGSGLRRRQSVDRVSMWDPEDVSWAKPTRPTVPPVAGRTNPKWSGSDDDGQSRLPKPYSEDNGPVPIRPRLAAPSFKSGQRVRHAKFGEGTVIESKITGNDEEVSVAFPGLGVKRLAASLANLEVIG